MKRFRLSTIRVHRVLLLFALLAFRLGAAPSQSILAPPGLAPDDQFGYSVASSGNLLVVGAPALGFPPTSPGAAYVYQRSGSAWTLQARLTPANGLPGDAFGAAVAIDGNTIVVGSPTDGTVGFAYIFVLINGVWVQQPDILRPSDNATFANFASSVAISKETIAVGAPFTSQGSVYVYVRSATTGFWDPQGKPLTPGDASGLSLGRSVTIAGDTIVAGAPRTSNFAGAAYVFARTAGAWTRTATLAPSPSLSNAGWSVALSANTLVIGAPDGNHQTNPGSALVFTSNNGVWTPQTVLPTVGRGGALVGWSVAINGNTIALGAPAEGSTDLFTGGAANWQLAAQQVPATGASLQAFGYAVAVVDGNTVAAGSPLASSRTGAVYVTQR